MILRNLFLAAVLALAALPAAARQAPPPGAPPFVPAPPPSAPPFPAAPPGAGTPLPDPGIVTVPFDLASGAFSQVLPFDLPFHLVGIAPPGVARIELQYVSSRQAILPTKIPSRCGPAQIVVPGHEWAPNPPSTWRYSPLLAQQPPPRFILTVPALEAQRYYTFRLRVVSTVTPDKAMVVQKLARELFDQTLDPLPRSRSLTLADTERIRTALIADVKSSLGADQVIAPGSLFDPCLDDLPKSAAEAVRTRFLEALQRVVDAQNGVYDNLTVLYDTRRLLRSALDQLAADPRLQGLLDRLELAAKTDPGIALFLQRDGGADLATARMTAVEPALLGPELPRPDAGSAALAGLDPRSLHRTYALTVSRLDQLRGWLEQLAHPAAANPASTRQLLTDADRQAAGQLLAGPLRIAQAAATRLQDASALLQDPATQRDAALDLLAQQVAHRAEEEVTVDASTTGSANTFQRYFITVDLGLLYSWGVSKLVPYAGTNIYFRPVNPNVPLSQKGGFGRRFSVTIGYTLQSIADTNQLTRKDLFGGGSLVVGAGLRLTESIRFAAGALIFTRRSTNPLITDDRVAASPYLSLSFDWKIAQTFAVVGQKLFGSATAP